MPKPIKRHEALQDLSRDHHQGLLLCFKIRQGLKQKTALNRIMDYCRFFYQQHLLAHFSEEEQILFPVLGNAHPMVKKALDQHRELNRLFTFNNASAEMLQEIEQKLKAHIRFEERELFNEIQDKAGKEKLLALNNQLHRKETTNQTQWNDPFWEKSNN